MKLAIGVMGGASGTFPEEDQAKLGRLGRVIAAHDAILSTGASPGLPQAVVEGAGAAGGAVVGISPALSLDEHVRKHGSPTVGYDVLIYTGSGLMGREVENIHSSDIVVIAGGSSGTLAEFAIAYDEGRQIGALTGTGEIADGIARLLPLLAQPTGAVVLYDDDLVRLIDRLIAYYRAEHHKHPNCFCVERVPELAAPALAGVAGGG